VVSFVSRFYSSLFKLLGNSKGDYIHIAIQVISPWILTRRDQIEFQLDDCISMRSLNGVENTKQRRGVTK